MPHREGVINSQAGMVHPQEPHPSNSCMEVRGLEHLQGTVNNQDNRATVNLHPVKGDMVNHHPPRDMVSQPGDREGTTFMVNQHLNNSPHPGDKPRRGMVRPHPMVSSNQEGMGATSSPGVMVDSSLEGLVVSRPHPQGSALNSGDGFR